MQYECTSSPWVIKVQIPSMFHKLIFPISHAGQQMGRLVRGTLVHVAMWTAGFWFIFDHSAMLCFIPYLMI